MKNIQLSISAQMTNRLPIFCPNVGFPTVRQFKNYVAVSNDLDHLKPFLSTTQKLLTID
jgi:hypothetical protein